MTDVQDAVRKACGQSGRRCEYPDCACLLPEKPMTLSALIINARAEGAKAERERATPLIDAACALYMNRHAGRALKDATIKRVTDAVSPFLNEDGTIKDAAAIRARGDVT